MVVVVVVVVIVVVVVVAVIVVILVVVVTSISFCSCVTGLKVDYWQLADEGRCVKEP